MNTYRIVNAKGGMVARLGAKSQEEAETMYRAGYKTGVIINGEDLRTVRHWPEGCSVVLEND